MSQYPPTGPQGQPNNPYGQPSGNVPVTQNENLPQFPVRQSSGKKLGCVLATLAIIGVCVATCCGGIIFLIGSFNNVDNGPAVSETDGQKQERFVKAFEGDPQIDQHPDLAGITSLIKQLQSATLAGDISELVDIDLLYREMLATKKMGPRPFGRRMFMNSIIGQTVMVREFTEFEIASIVEIDERPGEAIVMVHLSDTESTWREELFLVRKGNNWKIYDWGEVGTDIRGSFELAVINGDSSPSKYREYNRFFTNLDQAVETDDLEEAGRLLKRIDPDLAYKELSASMWCTLSGYWIGIQQPEEALKCLDKLANEESPPDAVTYRGMCAFQQGDYQRSIELFNRYEQLTGNCLNTKSWRADAYMMLDDYDNALGEYQAILAVMPNDPCIYDAARYSVDENDFELLASVISRTREPLETAELLAVSFHTYESYTGVKRISELAKQQNPDSATADFLNGLLLDLDGNRTAATESIRKAQNRAATDENAGRYSYALLNIHVSQGQVLEFYRQATNKADAFEQIYWSWEDDGVIDADTITQIARLHLKENPEDETAKSIVVRERLAREEFAQIIAEESELRSDGIDFWTLAEAYVSSGKELDALKTVVPFHETFVQISRELREAKAYDRLSKVLETYRSDLEPQNIRKAGIDGWESYYLASLQSQAVVLRNEDRFQEAAFMLVEAKLDDDSENRWLSESILSECLTTIGEAGDSVKDWLVLTNDQYKIRNPKNSSLSGKSISWDDFEKAYDRFYWGDEYELEEKILNRFADWQQSKPEFVLLRAKLLNNTNRSAEAGKLLSDLWLMRIKARSTAERISQPTIDLEGYFDYSGVSESPLQTAYALMSQTARLNGEHLRALKYGELLQKEFESTGARLQAACVAGDTQLVSKLLKEGNAGIWSLRFEEDVAKAFATPKFDSIRKEYPESWITNLFNNYTIFLFENPASTDMDTIRKIVNEQLGSVSWLPQPTKVDGEAQQSLMFQSGALLAKVSLGTKPLKISKQEIMSPGQSNLLSKHSQWIAVEFLSNKYHQDYDDRKYELLRRQIESGFAQFNPDAVLMDWQAIFKAEDVGFYFDPKFDINKVHELNSVRSVWIDDSGRDNGLSPMQIAELNNAALGLKPGEFGKLKLEVITESIGDSESCSVSVYQIKRGTYGQLNFYVEMIDKNPVAKFAYGKQKYFQVDSSSIARWSVD